PPASFCCSISISITLRRVVSEIAIVPESECRIPILIGSLSCAEAGAEIIDTPIAPASSRLLLSLVQSVMLSYDSRCLHRQMDSQELCQRSVRAAEQRH